MSRYELYSWFAKVCFNVPEMRDRLSEDDVLTMHCENCTLSPIRMCINLFEWESILSPVPRLSLLSVSVDSVHHGDSRGYSRNRIICEKLHTS